MLLQHGANPNARIDWKEIKYNKDFGVVKGPQDIPTGRHNISYVGATPFYQARHRAELHAAPRAWAIGTAKAPDPTQGAPSRSAWKA